MKKGIDVSSYNGTIEWPTVANEIDFAMIRAGYGKNHIDVKAIDNMNGCNLNSIPFGLYWFSYALSPDDALDEADYTCNIADLYAPTLPIAFDWEYGSDRYAKQMGANITNEKRIKICESFLSRVKARGYQPMIYTNPDYLENMGLKHILVPHDLWLAVWGKTEPNRSYDIWQHSSNGSVLGINGSVDMNIMKKDYTINAKKKLTNEEKDKFISALCALYRQYFGD